MGYISLINSFWDLASISTLSTGQVSLYFALLHVCNRSYWTTWFEAPNQVLSVLTGMSRSGILKARNELKQKKVIDFKERGTKPALYRITIADSVQVGVQDSVQVGVQVGVQDSVQAGVQDSVQVGVQDSKHILNILRQKQKTKTKTKTETLPPISPAGLFGSFWACYPMQKKRREAEKAYCGIVLSGEHTEADLVAAARNYAEHCRLTGTDRVYHPDNFLSKAAFEDYLPGRYKRPDVRGRGAFHRMEQNEYDFGELERRLLADGCGGQQGEGKESGHEENNMRQVHGGD